MISCVLTYRPENVLALHGIAGLEPLWLNEGFRFFVYLQMLFSNVEGRLAGSRREP